MKVSVNTSNVSVNKPDFVLLEGHHVLVDGKKYTVKKIGRGKVELELV